MNHTYVEQTFCWCDECLRLPGVQEMIRNRPLHEVEVAPGTYYAARHCGHCGKEATQ